jgi:hypothetical protein
VAIEELSTIAKPHTHLSSGKHEYRTCVICKVRKNMVCIKCGSCFLCHPYSEEIETRRPISYIALARLFDIESPILSEIKR